MITACNYGVHSFVRASLPKHLEGKSGVGTHLHNCTSCGATYFANDPCYMCTDEGQIVSKIETALFTFDPDAMEVMEDRVWKKHSGERVPVVYDPEADSPDPMDEFQVIFEGEDVNPWTVYRKELSDFRKEES